MPASRPRRRPPSTSASSAAGSPRSRRHLVGCAGRGCRRPPGDRRASSRPTSISTSPASSTAATSEEGTLQEAIAEVAAAKRAFTEDDVYARARRTLEKAIVQGTTRMRTHVEVDPRIGLHELPRHPPAQGATTPGRSISRSASSRRRACSTIPGAEELLVAACEAGADLIGGCPYTDSDPHGQIARIFAIARELRPRHRLPSRFRSRRLLDASRRGLPADRRTTATAAASRSAMSPSCRRCRPTSFDATARRLGRCRRRRHRAAGDRSVPDGPRPRPQRAARRRRRRTSCSPTASPARSPPTTCSTRSRRSATAR